MTDIGVGWMERCLAAEAQTTAQRSARLVERARADAAEARLQACEQQLVAETEQLRQDYANAHDDRMKEHAVVKSLQARIAELEANSPTFYCPKCGKQFHAPRVAELEAERDRLRKERDLLQVEVNRWIENDQISFERATRLDNEITALRDAVRALADKWADGCASPDTHGLASDLRALLDPTP